MRLPWEGSEQAGERPVLIVSNEPINRALPIVTVLPMTWRHPYRRVYSTEVLLPEGDAGQPNESIIMAHQVRTVSKDRLVRSYGWVQNEELRDKVRDAMRVHLDLDP